MKMVPGRMTFQRTGLKIIPIMIYLAGQTQRMWWKQEWHQMIQRVLKREESCM